MEGFMQKTAAVLGCLLLAGCGGGGQRARHPTSAESSDVGKAWLVFRKNDDGVVSIKEIRQHGARVGPAATVSVVLEPSGRATVRVGMEPNEADALGRKLGDVPLIRLVVSDHSPADTVVDALQALAELRDRRVCVESVEHDGPAMQADIEVWLYRGPGEAVVSAVRLPPLPPDLERYVRAHDPRRPFSARIPLTEVAPLLGRMLPLWPEKHVRIYGDQEGEAVSIVLDVARAARAAGARTLSFSMIYLE